MKGGIGAFLYAMGLLGSLISVRSMVLSFRNTKRQQQYQRKLLATVQRIERRLSGESGETTESELGYGDAMDYSDL